MKLKDEKKRPKFTYTFCWGCGEDHGKQSKLESSRRRRVESIMRRTARRELRQSRIHSTGQREIQFVLNVDISTFVRQMQEMAARMIKTGDLFGKSINAS